MLQNVEACEWLTGALRGLEVPNLDPIYANMRAVCILFLLFVSFFPLKDLVTMQICNQLMIYGLEFYFYGLCLY